MHKKCSVFDSVLFWKEIRIVLTRRCLNKSFKKHEHNVIKGISHNFIVRLVAAHQSFATQKGPCQTQRKKNNRYKNIWSRRGHMKLSLCARVGAKSHRGLAIQPDALCWLMRKRHCFCTNFFFLSALSKTRNNRSLPFLLFFKSLG